MTEKKAIIFFTKRLRYDHQKSEFTKLQLLSKKIFTKGSIRRIINLLMLNITFSFVYMKLREENKVF